MNTTKLHKDDKAPDFTLIDQDGKEFHLMSSGKKVLVYFYPRASTPGCTTQACALQDELSEFEAADVEIIGISPDDEAAQLKFAQEHDLTFPLLSDEDRSVAEAYGVWGEKSMFGKKVMGIIRSAFLIDEKGTIIQTWYEISPANTVPYLKKILGMS